VGGAVVLGIYPEPPPDVPGLSAVTIDEDSLFWSDAKLVRGAATATKYRDQLRDWLGDLLP
jgi:hypothetical protein